MKALLSVEQNNLDMFLQRTYFNPRCQFFYLGLMVVSIGLLLLTCIFGFEINDNFAFVFLEGLLNVCILMDFIFRVKLQGCSKYFHGGAWNIIETVVTVLCSLLFISIIVSRSSKLEMLEELGEQLLLISWTVF
mmetsp:Transcript_26268/g.25444  ORF Transcript_26268/g.25444 Transcript_26268/m.25444 type:complete len:134 (-) Transcript_26268:459-860(-)